MLEVGGDDGGDRGTEPGDGEDELPGGRGGAVEDQAPVLQSDHCGRGVDVETGHGVLLHTVDVVSLLVHHLLCGETVLLKHGSNHHSRQS